MQRNLRLGGQQEQKLTQLEDSFSTDRPESTGASVTQPKSSKLEEMLKEIESQTLDIDRIYNQPFPKKKKSDLHKLRISSHLSDY